MSSKTKLFRMIGILVVFVLVFGLAAPALANQMVKNGTFTGGITSWTNPTQTGTVRPWTYTTNQVELTTASGTRTGYIYQCVDVITYATGDNYNGGATFLPGSTGAEVDFRFFTAAGCSDGVDSGLSATADLGFQTASVGTPSFVSFNAPFAGSVLIVAICPIGDTYCGVDNISLNGSDGTVISLNSMSARSEQTWVVTLLLSTLLLTSGAIVVWQLRRYSKFQ